MGGWEGVGWAVGAGGGAEGGAKHPFGLKEQCCASVSDVNWYNPQGRLRLP